jgi:uncharacterized protein (TIGR03905 family)
MVRYKTTGVCATEISFDIKNGKIRNIDFQNGCNGNLQAVARLAEGMKAEDLINRLEGIKCGYKDTSCADQLVKALRQAMKK